MQVLLATCGSWYLRQTARAYLERGALGGLWISDKNTTGIPEDLYRRCWPFHLAMKPFYHLTPQLWTEKAFYGLFGLWKAWFKAQLKSSQSPRVQAVQAIMGYGTEAFDHAERIGALKVLDCANSHPSTAFGFWQRECDLWCPGERVPIPRWMYARMTRELERADLILCPSTFVRDSMLLNGLTEDKCFVNPFGVDTGVFRKRPEPPARPRFVCVGTICVRKGHQYLFRAFEKVKTQMPEAELVCVGEYKCDFRKERPRWEGSFRHHEKLTHPQLAELLSTCSAFVLASVEEGFARVISEAMGAGLPVIGTHESGASTQVTNGVEGFLVPARQPGPLADAMIRMARDRSLNQRLGDAAFARGGRSNTWQDYGDRLLKEMERRLPGTGTISGTITGTGPVVPVQAHAPA